jgi:hypothetical protein
MHAADDPRGVEGAKCARESFVGALPILSTNACNNIYIMLNYNRKQEKIALYRYKDVCNKNPRLQFNVTTQYAYKFVAKITTTL